LSATVSSDFSFSPLSPFSDIRFVLLGDVGRVVRMDARDFWNKRFGCTLSSKSSI
jgi:hypothetical protein